MKAIILAGGLGKRLRNTVKKLPKPMAPINGRPFLEYQMDYWIDQGITHFILSVGYLNKIIIDHFGSMYKGISIEYCIEAKPLGTGGALMSAAKNINETFLVLNGDSFIEIDLERLYKFHVKNNSMWTLSLFKAEMNERYMGIEVDENGRIISLKSNEKKINYYFNGGAYLINPAILRKIDLLGNSMVSLENELLPYVLTSDAEIYGLQCSGRFIDIGIPKDYFRASEIL
jgi:D-glycero-alpha-D-manno-heptose 1-phosphate guanylyltransferase